MRGSEGDLGLSAGINHYSQGFGEILLTAIPDTLVETELFGYRKGAFSGAAEDTPGMLGGLKAKVAYEDVLLDEIGDGSLVVQAKLLTVIDKGEFRPVGGRPGDEQKTNTRFMMATNRDLPSMVIQRTFREDLYWRARQFVIHVPPLREQPENIPAIARNIETELEKERETAGGVSTVGDVALQEEDIQWAKTYRWPGNVRQLQDGIRRFLFEEGARRLSEIIADWKDPADNMHEADIIRSAIADRLNKVLADPTAQPLGSFQELIGAIEKEAQSAVVEWYDAHALNKDQLHRIFPNLKYNSLVNKISQWRNKA